MDDGETLKQLPEVQHECLGHNFLPSLLVLGGLGLAVHYEELPKTVDGVPLIIVNGAPVSGKTKAVEAAMAIVGQTEKLGGNVLMCYVV